MGLAKTTSVGGERFENTVNIDLTALNQREREIVAATVKLVNSFHNGQDIAQPYSTVINKDGVKTEVKHKSPLQQLADAINNVITKMPVVSALKAKLKDLEQANQTTAKDNIPRDKLPA